MKNKPLVSIITCFLNEGKFLAEAVRSVRRQTYSKREILLVDDGSTDSSGRIARDLAALKDSRIRYLHHEGHINRGLSPSRNLGISEAKGELICFLDADDVLMPDKVEWQVKLMAENPDSGLVCGASLYWKTWRNNGKKDAVVSVGCYQNRLFEPPELMELLYPLGKGAAPTPNSLLVRREVVQAVGGFADEFGSGMYEDQAFLSKVYLRFPVYVSDRVCDKYRLRPNSICARALRAGDYHAQRHRYLLWLKRYLEDHQLGNSAIQAMLEEELAKPVVSEVKPRLSLAARLRRRIRSRLKSAVRVARGYG